MEGKRGKLGLDSRNFRQAIDRFNRQMLRATAEEVEKTIRKLTEMRDGLRHAVACRAHSHMECPTFRRILRAASSGALGARRKKGLTAP
jgi:hypothetical protein